MSISSIKSPASQDEWWASFDAWLWNELPLLVIESRYFLNWLVIFMSFSLCVLEESFIDTLLSFKLIFYSLGFTNGDSVMTLDLLGMWCLLVVLYFFSGCSIPELYGLLVLCLGIWLISCFSYLISSSESWLSPLRSLAEFFGDRNLALWNDTLSCASYSFCGELLSDGLFILSFFFCTSNFSSYSL